MSESEGEKFYQPVKSNPEALLVLETLSRYDAACFGPNPTGGRLEQLAPDGSWTDITDSIVPF